MTDIRRINAAEFKSRYYSEKKTQCDMVIEYLKKYGSITPLEALTAFNCMRLASRVSDLREAGYDIRTERSKDKQYAIYTLAEEGAEDA